MYVLKNVYDIYFEENAINILLYSENKQSKKRFQIILIKNFTFTETEYFVGILH